MNAPEDPEPGGDERDGRQEDGEDDELSELHESIDLMHRAQAGNVDASEELFRRYYPIVLRMVRGRMGLKLRRHVESVDLAQEAMLEAIRDFRGFRVERRSQLIALLVAIVEYRLKANARMARAQKRDVDREVTLQRVRDSIESGSIDLELADGAEPPPEEVARAEQQVRLREEVEKLEPGERRVIELRQFHSLSWEEVARAIGSPSANAARMTHARALMKLKAALKRIDGLDLG